MDKNTHDRITVCNSETLKTTIWPVENKYYSMIHTAHTQKNLN